MHSPHHPVKADNVTSISSFSQPAPELHKTEGRGSSSHVSDKLEFFRTMLTRMGVGTPGSDGQGLKGTIIAIEPEIDVGAGFVILSRGSGNPVFHGKTCQGLAILHILCYCVHEK